MITIADYAVPKTLEGAYKVLISKKSNTVLGGCAFLRLGSKKIGTAIDLSKLNLNFINEGYDWIEIGAMTTFRDIETNSFLIEYFDGILPQSVSNIVGVQFRNIATVGGTVYSKYGFSDLITALLALDTEVVLYKRGQISLKNFLEEDFERDILIKIMIPKGKRRASFKTMRNSQSDYAILNAAVSNFQDDLKIAVGARPQRAQIAEKASRYLSSNKRTDEDIEYAAELAAKELSFGTNIRASKEYREHICKVLVKRAVQEVVKWR